MGSLRKARADCLTYAEYILRLSKTGTISCALLIYAFRSELQLTSQGGVDY